MDGLREVPQLLSHPTSRLFKSMRAIQASVEESPIGGVRGSYQERVRLMCILEIIDIGSLSCRPQTRGLQVGVQDEARLQGTKQDLWLATPP
jgi:hypothetical protein